MYDVVGVIPPPATSSCQLEGGTLGPQEIHGNGSDGENPSHRGTGSHWKGSCNKNAIIWNESKLLLFF